MRHLRTETTNKGGPHSAAYSYTCIIRPAPCRGHPTHGPSPVASAPREFLAAFIALNTIMYVALAVAKMLPKVHLSDWVHRRGRRSETRSIHPTIPCSDDPMFG